MKILFIDTDCPEPLDSRVLGTRPLGGTESTLFHVADGLAASGGVEVGIAQHNRGLTEVMPNQVRYLRYHYRGDMDLDGEPDVVVVLRNHKILPAVRRRFPQARLMLWMHCFPGRRWRRSVARLHQADVTIITVSDALASEMARLHRPVLPAWEARARVKTIYNPISPRMPLGSTPRAFDPDKLVFFSSPHKGLSEVLECFAAVRRAFPSMRLCLADPGYWRGPKSAATDGVEVLGALSPAEVHRHVAEALCVFYPQTTFAETFGLVFAEANALGTPVIAHPLGSAREVLDQGGLGQVIDCRSPARVVEVIRRWREGGRPTVAASPDFRLDGVTARWRDLLMPEADRARARDAA